MAFPTNPFCPILFWPLFSAQTLLVRPSLSNLFGHTLWSSPLGETFLIKPFWSSLPGQTLLVKPSCQTSSSNAPGQALLVIHIWSNPLSQLACSNPTVNLSGRTFLVKPSWSKHPCETLRSNILVELSWSKPPGQTLLAKPAPPIQTKPSLEKYVPHVIQTKLFLE